MYADYLWAGVSGVLGGVALRSVIDLGWSFAWFLLFLSIITLAVCVHSWRKPAILAAVLLLTCAGGYARMHIVDTGGDPVLETRVEEEVQLEGSIVNEVDERERTVRVVIEPTMIEGASVDTHSRVLLVLWRPQYVRYGDVISVEGVLEKPESFDSDGGRIFNYPAFLAKDNIYYEMAFPDIEVVQEGSAIGVRGTLFYIKETYLDGLGKVLIEPHAALAGGITVGDKRALGGALLDVFRITGIVHIVVLSGYNITIVAESIRRVFARAPRMLGLVLSALSIIFFVIATGASATGVRAGAMASLALVAKATHRPYAITRALALTAVGMVLWSPFILLHDPGFQLSVLATIGLIHVAPLIEERLQWVTNRLGFREIVGATLGTQIFVLPLLLYQMGLLSLVALPVNLLVLPVIPLAMLFSFIAGAVGAFSTTLGIVAAAPAYALLSYSLWIVDVFAKLPLASLSLESFSIWWVIVAYVVFAFALWHCGRGKQP